MHGLQLTGGKVRDRNVRNNYFPVVLWRSRWWWKSGQTLLGKGIATEEHRAWCRLMNSAWGLLLCSLISTQGHGSGRSQIRKIWLSRFHRFFLLQLLHWLMHLPCPAIRTRKTETIKGEMQFPAIASVAYIYSLEYKIKHYISKMKYWPCCSWTLTSTANATVSYNQVQIY